MQLDGPLVFSGRQAVRRCLLRPNVFALGVVLTTLAVFALATVARATPTYSGSRSTSSPGQLVTDDDWSTSHGGFKITFSVDWNGSYWTYDYHFYDANGSDLDPHISRFLKLQVSDVEGAWFKLVSDGHTPGYSSGDLIDLEPFDISFHLWDAPVEDPTYGFFGLFIGDDNDNTTDELSDSHVTFVSSQGPMWGSFYARDGDASGEGGVGPAEAVNRGIDGGDIPSPGGGTLSSVARAAGVRSAAKS